MTERNTPEASSDVAASQKAERKEAARRALLQTPDRLRADLCQVAFYRVGLEG